MHALKFQAVAATNGLIAKLYGPGEGRRHGSAILAMSGLLPQLSTIQCVLHPKVGMANKRFCAL